MSKNVGDIKRQELVLVKWNDSQSSSGGWKNAEDIKSWADIGDPCETVGWVVHVDPKKLSIVVASSYDDDTDSVVHLMLIRMENITEIRRLDIGPNITRRLLARYGVEFSPGPGRRSG